MKKIFMAVLAVCLLGTLIQANDKREVVVSKFKKQPKTIRPLSITKFELTDKNGDTKIIDLKGQKIMSMKMERSGG